MFSAGETVGNYLIEERLGAGGFGEVFRATELGLRRPVALKFVRSSLAQDPVFVERFQREVSAMVAVEHSNVVPIFTHGVERGLPYFSMRYVRGGSLEAVLAARQPSLEDVVDLLAGVAEGLDYCHTQGIVHRDLKPANVLVESETGRGLLADFGIAHAEDFATITGPGKLIGTPAYMAPETLDGGRATAASDLWALAAVAYRVATNTLPRGHGAPADTPVVPPSRRNARLGPEVDRVLLRGLAREPARRHRDARSFVSDLREALDQPRHRTTSSRLGPRAVLLRRGGAASPDGGGGWRPQRSSSRRSSPTASHRSPTEPPRTRGATRATRGRV
ncbi:serine/threonine-protein kinase [Solirubrobacter soli]|uniref:serine/threonine-protein kinase n=1 Tax=Solirubrobacter soli TaxID=363832 RepID=UPI000412CD29|nr:serine/threonine-protein kinase [Solirubrobacter soli]